MLIAKKNDELTGIQDYEAKKYRDDGYEILNMFLESLTQEEIDKIPAEPQTGFAGIII